MLALMGASVSGVDNVQLFPLCFPEPRPALGEAKGNLGHPLNEAKGKQSWYKRWYT